MKAIFTLIFIMILAIACNKQDIPEEISEKPEETSHNNVENEAHWSYAGETGPDHWDEIEKDSDCDGLYQSPINIIDVNTLDDDGEHKLEIEYADTTKIHDVTNNGHSIQYNFNPGDYLFLNGEQFDLKQIHFHEPSEHTLNGIRYPMEIHMVHMNEDGEYAVLGVMVQEGESSLPFDFLEHYLPVRVGETKSINKFFDLTDNLPDNKDYYYYNGSLTTPPCTEGVNWFVFKDPITISLNQVKLMKALMPINNYRYEQPLNGRVVTRSSLN